MKGKKCKIPKYAFGGLIESPYTALAENDIAKAKAVRKSNSGFTQTLDILGNLGMKVGSQLMAQGMSQGQGVSTGADGIGAGQVGDTGDGFNWGSLLQSVMGMTQGLATGVSTTHAAGGIANGKVNVEGGEMFETPGGSVGTFKGPSHEQDGINTNLPPGTEIFSKRVKGPDGKTMAQRKKSRERAVARLEKIIKDNPSDTLAKKTLEKTIANNELQEQEDLMLMESLRQEGSTYATGGYVNPIYDPSMWDWSKMVPNPNLGYTENTSNFGKNFGSNIPQDFYSLAQGIAKANNYNLDFSNTGSVEGFQGLLGVEQDGVIGNDTYGGMQKYVLPLKDEVANYDTNTTGFTGSAGITQQNSTLGETSSRGGGDGSTWSALGDAAQGVMGQYTTGDLVGMFGSLWGPNKLMDNTLKNRAGDTPNINAFENFGKKSMEKLEGSKQYVNQIRDQQLKSLATSRNSAIKAGRNSARGVNMMRALDIAAQMNTDQASNQVHNQFMEAMMGIQNQEAQMLATIDNAVMSGEQQRDLRDRQDRDAFFTNLAQNISAKGQGIQMFGKHLNTAKERDTTNTLINQGFKHLDVDLMSGNITQKDRVAITGTPVSEQIASFVQTDVYKNMTPEQKEEWNNSNEAQKRGLILELRKRLK